MWAGVTVDVDFWVVFCETLVLVTDFKVEVTFVETSGVAILDVVTGGAVLFVTLFEPEETEVDGFTVLLEDSFLWLEGTCWIFSVELALELCGDTGFFVVGGTDVEAESPTAAPISASTCSAPRSSAARAPRAPTPIVPRAGRGGLVGLQPRW